MALTLCLAVVVLPWPTPLPGWLSLAWGLMYVVPLLWRRVDPDVVALALIPAHLIQLVVTSEPVVGNIVVPIMMFTVAAYGRLHRRTAWLVFGGVASVLAAGDWLLWGTEFNPAGQLTAASTVGFLFAAVALSSIVAAAWALGAFVRARNDAAASRVDAALATQAQHAQAVVLAASQERQRLAREMHDVVAHSLAVIVVQADGGAYAAAMDGDPAVRLATAERALATIRSTAQDALGETRRLVGVLRSDQGTELAPAASLDDLTDLIASLADAGRDVTLQQTGDPAQSRALSPGLQLAVYRIVQEALTNTVKHAGDGVRVLVHVHHAPDGISLEVRDDGRGAGPTDGLGHGLVGMHERASAFGGTLSAHDHPEGGYVVRAHLPASPPSPTPQGAHA